MKIPNGRSGFPRAARAPDGSLSGDVVETGRSRSLRLPADANPAAAAIPVPRPKKFLRLKDGECFIDMASSSPGDCDSRNGTYLPGAIELQARQPVKYAMADADGSR